MGTSHPCPAQVETASRVAGGLDFDSGRHRPWSLPRLHAHATLDLSKDRKARRRSRARAAAKRAARDGVAIDGVSGPGRVGLRPAALRDLLGGAPDPDPAADASLDYGALRAAGRRRPGQKRVIQRRFNVSVPRARVPKKASTLRDRSER